MSSHVDSACQLLEPLAEFTRQAGRIWTAYQVSGPGGVERESFDGVDASASELRRLLGNAELIGAVGQLTGNDPERWLHELADAVGRAHDLSYRCACTSLGLCFITGEAGLLPRRDQHESFQQALGILRDRFKELKLLCDPQ